ncbi:imm11 family protein [Kluyvera sichuanensis]|uniref:imm11 family protein n=1 Tax=Kluyvera sichuanensis TaxID=2725494 RepID=UPI0039F713C2
MSYILSIEESTYNMLDYLHDISMDFSLFNEGVSLKGLDCVLKYKAKNKSSFKKLRSCHILSSTGPDLVSRKLRTVIENVVPAEVEFFDAEIIYGDEVLYDFSVINPIMKLNCCDMDKCEYQLTNFDPNNPTYMFLYTVLSDNIPEGLNMVRCKEQPNLLIVNDKIKSEILNADLKGIRFCKAIDLTYKERTVCE